MQGHNLKYILFVFMQKSSEGEMTQDNEEMPLGYSWKVSDRLRPLLEKAQSVLREGNNGVRWPLSQTIEYVMVEGLRSMGVMGADK